MGMIEAMTLAQLQVTRNLLIEWRNKGISLDVGSSLIDREERTRRITLIESMQHGPTQKLTQPDPCPDCGAALLFKTVDGLLIAACNKCRWSNIKEYA